MKPRQEEAGTEQPSSLWWQHLLVRGVTKKHVLWWAMHGALVLVKPCLLYMAVFLVAQISTGLLQHAACFVEVGVSHKVETELSIRSKRTCFLGYGSVFSVRLPSWNTFFGWNCWFAAAVPYSFYVVPMVLSRMSRTVFLMLTCDVPLSAVLFCLSWISSNFFVIMISYSFLK